MFLLLAVRLSVCLTLDYPQSSELILIIFRGVGCGPRKNRLDLVVMQIAIRMQGSCVGNQNNTDSLFTVAFPIENHE